MKRQQKSLDKDQVYNLVKGHPFFNGVAFPEVHELLDMCELQEFDAMDIIFEANKPRLGLFLLLEGIAEVYVHGEKMDEVLEVVQKGEMIGFSTLADFLGVSKSTKYEQMVEVKAVEEVKGLLIPFSVLEHRYRDEGVRDYLLQQVSARLKDIYASLAEQVKLSRQIGESNHFVMRVQDMMASPVRSARVDSTVQEIAQLMRKHHTSSVVLLDGKELVGIITEQDLVERVIAQGKSLESKAELIMTKNPYTIARFAYFYDALSTMVLNGVKHLPVVDEDKVVGIVTLSDLLRKRNESMMKTIQRLDHVDDGNLSQIKHAIYDVLETLIDDHIPMLHTLNVITTLYDRVVTRCVELAVESLKKNENIEPPVAFCWYQMGSAGRAEQFVLTDQDHFLVYDNPNEEDKEETKRYFEQLGKKIVFYLEKAGYALCEGKMMSSEPMWRGSLSRWQERLRHWMLQATNDNILLAQNFFSCRMLYGDDELHENFIETIQEQLERSKAFFYRMAQLEKESPVPTLDQPIRSLFRLEKKSIDMKKEVLFPFHHGLQILSITHGIITGTPEERINRLVQKGVLTAGFAADIITAFEEVMQVYVKQKWQQTKRGEKTSSVLTFTHLTSREKDDLILTLKTFRELQGQMFGEFAL